MLPCGSVWVCQYDHWRESWPSALEPPPGAGVTTKLFGTHGSGIGPWAQASPGRTVARIPASHTRFIELSLGDIPRSGDPAANAGYRALSGSNKVRHGHSLAPLRIAQVIYGILGCRTRGGLAART